MSEPDVSPRHLEGHQSLVDLPYIKIQFQTGAPSDEGINGCRVEEIIDVLVDKLLEFQARSLSCPENDTALYHLGLAKDALAQRRRHREQQGVLGTVAEHKSE